MAGLVLFVSGCVLEAFKVAEEGTRAEEAYPWGLTVRCLAYSQGEKHVASGHWNLWRWRYAHVRGHCVRPPAQIRLWAAMGWGSPNLNSATFNAPSYEWDEPVLRFSPDGKFVFAATRNGLLRWDIDEQRLDKRFEGWPGPVLSPTCRIAARRLVDEEQLLAQTFRFQDGDEADPSTTKRVSPEDHGKIEILDVESGALLNELPAKSEPGSPTAFSPDEEVLACWRDKEVILWHLPTRTIRGRIGPIEMPYLTSAFSPDWRYFAVCGFEKGPVAVFDTSTGRQRFSLPVGDAPWCIAFSPDGKLLAVGREGLAESEHGEIQLWDLATGKLHTKWIDRSTWGITALCFSPGGGTLASGCGNGKIKFWPVPDPKPSE